MSAAQLCWNNVSDYHGGCKATHEPNQCEAEEWEGISVEINGRKTQRTMWHCCLPSNLHCSVWKKGKKGWQHQHQCSHSKQKGLLFSEDACNRHRMGKDAKQLAGKLTASAVTVWKYFNKLETISKMVDSSDSVRRQRAALCRLSVYFSSMIKFTAKRQATGDRLPSSRCYFCRPLLAAPLGFLPLPAHTNTALATTKANMCDLLPFTASGAEKKQKTTTMDRRTHRI